MEALTPVLSPRGRLTLQGAEEGTALDTAVSRRICDAFDRGTGHGLLHLGIDEIGAALPPLFAFWREFAARYVAALCALGGSGEEPGGKPDVACLEPAELERIVAAVPPMRGA